MDNRQGSIINHSNRGPGVHDSLAFKVLTADEVAALDADIFLGAQIDRADGFIHLSTAAQLTETVQRHFAGQRDLSIAVIDLLALGDRVRWEPSRHGQLFPHLYAPLPRAAVRACAPLQWEADGTVHIPV